MNVEYKADTRHLETPSSDITYSSLEPRLNFSYTIFASLMIYEHFLNCSSYITSSDDWKCRKRRDYDVISLFKKQSQTKRREM